MNIWLIQTGEPIPIRSGVRKMRMAILADKLLERRHSVFWWASAFEHQRKVMLSKKDKSFNISERYIIRVLRGCGYKKNVSLARYIDHHIVALKFRIQSKKLPMPNIIVAATPDHLLAFEAARYAKKHNITFFIDIRDLWPDIFLTRFKNMGLSGIGKLILSLDFARLKFLLNSADSLVAVSKGYLNWGLNRIGRPERSFDKVFYLGYKNSSARNQVHEDEDQSIPDWLKRRKDQKVFVFIGTFGVSYELELILDAAEHFEKLRKNNICFVLAGTGEKFNLIKTKAARLHNVFLPGWIGEKEINSLLNRSYAGLVPCKSIEDTMPNKPFEYLSSGLPLINSLEGEMAELIDTHRLGLNYPSGDLECLCQCIERLATDHGMYNEVSRNALNFFEKYGDADKIYNEYAEHIERMVEVRR